MQDEDVLDAERLPELLLAALEDVVGMRERQEAFLCAEELLEEALVGAGRGVAGRELEALQAREERGEAFGARRHRQDPSVELRDRVVPDAIAVVGRRGAPPRAVEQKERPHVAEHDRVGVHEDDGD